VIVKLSLSTYDISKHWHWSCIIHLSVFLFVRLIIFTRICIQCLTTIKMVQAASVSSCAQVLIPKSAFHHDLSMSDALKILLLYVNAVISLIAFFMAATVPHSPPLYFQVPSESHSPVSVETKDGTDHDFNKRSNVSCYAEASVLGLLLFTWVTEFIKNSYSKTQLSAADLPYLVESLRASNIYKKVFTEVEPHWQLEDPKDSDQAFVKKKPKLVNRLFWRLLAINKMAFIVQMFMAIMLALVYYIPGMFQLVLLLLSCRTNFLFIAFFMKKLVFFLEVRGTPGEEDVNYGYAYCAGLILGLHAKAIISGQLWFFGKGNICTQLKVQLNTLIYAKTLKVRFHSPTKFYPASRG
jgi:hypothetical protein